MSHMGRVIVVDPVSEQAARRIGFDVAPSLDRAIEQAKDLVGRIPQITYFHCPPIAMCDLA